MQNRKEFLKTAALGVVGATGLALLPTKARADIPTKDLKYFLPIGTFIDLNGLTNFHNINTYAEMHDIIYSGLEDELNGRNGTIFPVPSYHDEFGYGYEFDFEEIPEFTSPRLYSGKIDKTMKHIIDGTSDPFMDYPYAD